MLREAAASATTDADARTEADDAQQLRATSLEDLRRLADSGNATAARQLVDRLVADAGPDLVDDLRREVFAGNTGDAARALMAHYAAGDPERERDLLQHGLDVDGRPARPGAHQ